MGRILGKNIAIFRMVNGKRKVVGLSTGCSIDLQTDMVEHASMASAFRAYRPGKSGGTIQIERLFDTSDTLGYMALQVSGTPISYVVEVDGMTVSGEAYISSQSAGAPVGGYATHNVTLTLTGEVYIDMKYITFADAVVAQICAENWGDEGGITASQAKDVKTIGTKFYNNKRVASFNELALFTGLTSLDSYAFSGCNSLMTITMPDSVKRVGGRVFEGCYTLGNVVMSANLENIGAYMFNGCGALPEAYIPAKVKTIGTEAFKDCTRAVTAEIPEGVTSIGDRAFYGCTGMTSVTVRAKIPPTLGTDAFANGNASRRIKVPAESYYDYLRATNWSDLSYQIERL